MPYRNRESPAGNRRGWVRWARSVFLQRGVFLVQRFLALEVGLDASVTCAVLVRLA